MLNQYVWALCVCLTVEVCLVGRESTRIRSAVLTFIGRIYMVCVLTSVPSQKSHYPPIYAVPAKSFHFINVAIGAQFDDNL